MSAIPFIESAMDAHTIEHLDFDMEVACEVEARRQAVGGTPICKGDPASWVAWRPNCCPQSPKYLLICHHCKGIYQAWQAKYASISCGDCGMETGGFIAYTWLNRRKA